MSKLSRLPEIAMWSAQGLGFSVGMGSLAFQMYQLTPMGKRFVADTLKKPNRFDRFLRWHDILWIRPDPDLIGLRQFGYGKSLKGVDLRNLVVEDELQRFEGARFDRADLRDSSFQRVCLIDSSFQDANLQYASFTNCSFGDTTQFEGADLSGATFINCSLVKSNFDAIRAPGVKFINCKLQGASFKRAELTDGTFSNSNLIQANFSGSNLERNAFACCDIYGINLWGTRGEITRASALRVKNPGSDEPEIEIDGLHIAVFLDSLRRGNGVRELVDGVSSSLVLILGRFASEHKLVLDQIRDHLRELGYLAILFDTSKCNSRDLSETVQILARLSRFVIADVTAPRSAPHELQQFIPFCSVPTIALSRGGPVYSMCRDNEKYPWVLPARSYADSESLLADIGSIAADLDSLKRTLDTRTPDAGTCRT
ncbi:pentapeptide repeat-containing protein [Nocardia sp. GCM10030253]|uniref:pentapeptide repeat-containing protein n=1 Tax=Nocardia sp. GCM10030253 TaxID=3273404 RepID=UPI0036292DC4